MHSPYHPRWVSIIHPNHSITKFTAFLLHYWLRFLEGAVTFNSGWRCSIALQMMHLGQLFSVGLVGFSIILLGLYSMRDGGGDSESFSCLRPILPFALHVRQRFIVSNSIHPQENFLPHPISSALLHITPDTSFISPLRCLAGAPPTIGPLLHYTVPLPT